MNNLLFIIGPYAAPTKEGVEANIRRAAAVAERFWQRGFIVICPHTNSAHFDESGDKRQLYIRGYQELLRICRYAVVLPGWRESTGSIAEIEIAEEAGVYVYFEPPEKEKEPQVADK